MLEIIAVELVKLIDFSRMEQINTSFIDDDFGEREADIAFRVPFHNGWETDELIIYILIEQFGWLLTVLQKENAGKEEMKCALIEAMSHINALDEAQRHEWERAICYLHTLIQNRRPAEEREDWTTFFVEHTSQGKEIDIMRTIADMHYEDEGIGNHAFWRRPFLRMIFQTGLGLDEIINSERSGLRKRCLKPLRIYLWEIVTNFEIENERIQQFYD